MPKSLSTLRRRCFENAQQMLKAIRHLQFTELSYDDLLFLSETGKHLCFSLERSDTLNQLAKLVVPKLADWFVLDLIDEKKNIQREIFDPKKRNGLAVSQSSSQSSTCGIKSVGALDQVLRTGEAHCVSSMPDLVLPEALGDLQYQTLMKHNNVRSCIIVPLKARGMIIGVITYCLSRGKRAYQKDNIRLVLEFSDRVAHSMENVLLYQRVKEAVRLRDDFISIASHEIKTPLTSIHLKHQLLQKAVLGHLPKLLIPSGQGYPLILRLLDSCEEQTKKLIQLISQLLDYSKMQAGKIQLQVEFLDFSKIIQEVISDFPMPESQLNSLISVPKSVPIFGYWDRLRIEQITTNLVSNAMKYGKDGPIEVTVEVDSGLSVARLVVRDHGIGIPEDRQSQVFDRFERVVTEQKIEGIGIGLYITRQIVEAHNGKIWLESSMGKGTTFTVELPVQTTQVFELSRPETELRPSQRAVL